VQGLVTLGLRTSVVGELAPPLPKAYSGLLSGFTVAGNGSRPTA
jgi:allantoin racemase